ncbi:MAG TPA: hypothetical protein VLV49_11155 [Terriglobales bacterium]|nr:hypothetical protein [Terriglobales bacterium]
MKLMTAILVLGMAAAPAWGQNLDAIQNTRDTMKAVQQKKAIDSNAALDAAGVKRSGQAAKPAMRGERRAAASKPSPGHNSRSARGSASAGVKRHEKVEHVSVEDNKQAKETGTEKHREINLTGLRDPFLSPVVLQSAEGSGCSTGKKCLDIGQIVLKGVVKSDAGMIAVVVNALDKAYFLHENDPVFNGYVLRITGDSVVFRETYQDKLGKPETREVTKRIITPAV